MAVAHPSKTAMSPRFSLKNHPKTRKKENMMNFFLADSQRDVKKKKNI
jgi:hypothetical protein